MATGIPLIARRSIRARLGRLIAIAVAIVIGVSFVVGSFVLADSLRSAFDELFNSVSENVDFEVRSAVAFDEGNQGAQVQRDPIPDELGDTIAGVEGVAAIEPLVQRYAQFIGPDGEPVSTQGAPMFGFAWTGDETLSGIVVREGRAPQGPEEMAMDLATAEREDFAVGNRVQVLTDTGTHEFELVGLLGVGDSDGFFGATAAVWDVSTAQQVLGAEGVFDAVDFAVEEGADPQAVRQRVQDVLPDGLEIVDRQTLIDEANDSVNQFIGPFGTGLLVFAFITAFVSAFLINNVFAITIGQRLRELALLRAIGGSGRQVRRMIYLEALMMSVVATLLGIGGGMLVAKGIISVFNAAGAGFPDTGLVLLPRSVLMAFLVGVGITMLAVIAPALRAARIPPVAAMRPELGFEALSTKRLVLGAIVTAIGVVMFLYGIFGEPGGTLGTVFFGGGGGLLIFLGVTSLSSTVARPVTRVLGWPIAKLYGTPGKLAQENAGRAPRRTSASASALMIGVALVSAASVFASSLRSTFTEVLERGVTADLLVLPANQNSGQGLPPIVAQRIAELPEVSASTPVRGVAAQVDGDTKFMAAADPTSLPELINLDVAEGGFEGLDDGGVMIHRDPAEDLNLAIGDTVSTTFQSGETRDLRVVGIYNDASLAGNWLISLTTLDDVSSSAQSDFFIALRLADGVDAATGRRAVEDALSEFPQAEVQSNAEFRDQLEGQIDQLLIVITVLLAFSIVIAVLGISITLALGVFERTREIGLMRAVGMTKRQTRKTVRWEAVIVSLFGALVGIIVGTLIGIALSMAVPDTVIDDISLSVTTIVIILVGAVLAGLIAALYPSYKASNMNVLEAIATE
jgi:putative ABC transport system permease protein